MAYRLADRVRETTTTTGTGAIALGGAVSGFRTFASVLATSDTAHYAIVLGEQWEIGLGTLTAASTLARTTVLASSNNNALVSFDAGIKDVFVTVPGPWLQKSRERTRVARTGNVQITATNNGDLIDVTSGAFTQTFASAAALGAGFELLYDNSGSGTITLSGVTGLASVIPGALVMIQSDGVAIRGYVLNASGKGRPGGFAELDAAGLVPDAQIGTIVNSQVWQQVSRAGNNTSHQNVTGKPIQLSYNMAGANTVVVSLSIDNSSWTEVARAQNNNVVNIIVPNNVYYRYSVSGAGLATWELR